MRPFSRDRAAELGAETVGILQGGFYLGRGARVELAPAVRSRIARVLAAGTAHGHDAIILGTW